METQMRAVYWSESVLLLQYVARICDPIWKLDWKKLIDHTWLPLILTYVDKWSSYE